MKKIKIINDVVVSACANKSRVRVCPLKSNEIYNYINDKEGLSTLEYVDRYGITQRRAVSTLELQEQISKKNIKLV